MLARHFVHRFLYRFTDRTTTQVGEVTNKDHATVLNSCNVIESWIEVGDAYGKKYGDFVSEMFMELRKTQVNERHN